MKYRPEIDGLRAIAVIAVILFHTGAISGGYIGVDVFFVISGYLIAGIILNQLQNNTFIFKKFYERRARRILPALTLVTISTVPFAWYLLPPKELEYYGKSLVAIVLFASNILFSLNRGYFNNNTELMPLLHTWSIGVEEQFYVIFPIIILLSWRYAKKHLLYILIFLGLISLLYSAYICKSHPTFNFYLLPSRGWELIAGACIAYYVPNIKVKGRIYDILTIIGLISIFASIYYFNQNTPSPGFITCIPIIGTMLILISANNNGISNKFLSFKPLVTIGLLSYSLYLWHMPLIIFANIYLLGKYSYLIYIIVLPVTCVLSYFTWRFIETPFRNSKIIKLNMLLVYITIMLLLISSAGIYFIYTKGLINQLNILLKVLQSSQKNNSPKHCVFPKEVQESNQQWYCQLGSKNVHVQGFIVGDSHAKVTYLPFNQAAKKAGKSLLLTYTPGCLPLFIDPDEDLQRKQTAQCKKMNRDVFEHIEKNKIKKLIIVARWNGHLSMHRINGTQLSKALTTTIERYSKINTKVTLLLQVPEQKTQPFLLYKRAYDQPLFLRNKFIIEHSTTINEYYMQKINFMNIISNLNSIEFSLIDPTTTLCKNKVCAIGTANNSYYDDEHHLSVGGGMLLATQFYNELKKYN